MRFSSISFFGLVHHDSASVSNLEGQDGHGDSDVEDLLNVQLNLDGAVFDSLWGLDNLSGNFHNRFGGDLSRKFFALLAGSLLKHDGLDGVVSLTHDDEATLALRADVLGTSSNSNSLSFQTNIEVR